MVINLLPEKEKKELAIEKTKEKITLFLFLVLGSLIFLGTIIFFLKSFISYQVEVLQKKLSQEQTILESSQFRNFKHTILETNKDLIKILNFYKKQIFLFPVLEELSNLTPPKIYFTSFSFQKQQLEKKQKKKEKKEQKTKIFFGKINVIGWAENRDDLFFFKKKIQEVKRFKEIYFSLSSWVQPFNINFSFSFKLAAEN